MPLVRRPALALAVAAALAGCATDDAPARGWATVVDTLPNGAVLVSHSPPEDPTVTWTFEPDLRIGAMDGTGPDVFGDIRDLAVGPDGRMAVLDAQAQEVRLFGPDGRHLRTFGGKGAGPGEFQGANGVAWGPDGLLRVPDHQNTRLTLIHPDTGLAGSHSFQPLMFGWRWGGVIDSAGHSWSLHYRLPEAPGEDGTMQYVELALDGTPGDTIHQPEQPTADPDAGQWSVEMSGGRRMTMGVPEYPRAQYRLDPRRRVWSTVRDDPAYRLIRWTADGDTALVLHVDRPPVPVDRARIDSMVTAWEGRFGITLDRSKIPDTAPAIDGFFFDGEGRLWVRPQVAPGDSSPTLDAFDAETGDYLGTLAVPDELQATNPPAVIRDGMLWGVVRDELDVPRVVRGKVGSGRGERIGP